MHPRMSVWAYAWDFADEGVAAALDWLRDTGFNAAELGPNYHAISTFSPRNLHRSIFYSEQGAVYFPARASRYGRIKPRVFDESAVVRAFGETAELAPARDVQLNAWIIGMFQPWMAREYPDVAVENAFGDRSFAQTCPASPDVQEYLGELLTDLCDQYAFHSVVLERLGHADFGLGWVRERILIELDGWTRYLAGLCFCENCLNAARAHGVDGNGVRLAVATEIRDRITGGDRVDNVTATVATRCELDEEFRGYLETKEQTARQMVDRVKRALGGTNVRLTLTDVSAGWNPNGLRMPDLTDRIDGVLLSDVTGDPDETTRQVKLAQSATNDIELLVSLWASDDLGPYRDEFTARIDRITKLDVDRIAVYNFGLLRPDTLRHVGELIRRSP